MKNRVYFDTSIFGGVFDKEFEKETIDLFQMVRNGELTCVYSDLTISELSNAPEKVKEHFAQLPEERLEKVEVSDESSKLAQLYIKEGVIGKTSFDDCLHIATATIENCNLLVSWNFKHIVNVFRIRGYNSINIREGYNRLEIRSPKDIIEHGN